MWKDEDNWREAGRKMRTTSLQGHASALRRAPRPDGRFRQRERERERERGRVTCQGQTRGRRRRQQEASRREEDDIFLNGAHYGRM